MNIKWFDVALVCVGVIIVITGFFVVALTTRDDTGLATELLGITMILVAMFARKFVKTE